MISLKSILKELNENQINQVVDNSIQGGWPDGDNRSGTCEYSSKLSKSSRASKSKKRSEKT